MFGDKLYFKIGEVAKITKVKPYILRYWESEFKIINPVKSVGNQRVYKRKDVEFILYIKKLLYDEKYTLEGAKKKIKEEKNSKPQMTLPFSEKEYIEALKAVKKDLSSIKDILRG